ncbi:MAG: hypothetical protein RI907_1344 [Pseudomonadota bacterium]|jgi:hypothetical protein
MVRNTSAFALVALLTCLPTAHASGGEATVLSSRVDRVIASDDERRALGNHVQCRDVEGAGPWLLVSRSWGGSPNLRHHRLVSAPQNGVQVGDRLAVRWDDCAQSR